MDPIAAILLAVAIIAAALERFNNARTVTAEREAWREERAELLARIQRPDIVMPRARPVPAEQTDKATRAPAALTRVGQVMPLRDPDPAA